MRLQFDEHEIDIGRRELRRGDDMIALEPQVFDLLVYLLRNRDRVVSKDDMIAEVWAGRIVSESTLSSRINAVRKAVGDSGDAQKLIRTIPRKGVRFVGDVSDPDGVLASIETSIQPGSTPIDLAPVEPAPALRQDIHFCTASDGVRIAYAEVGSGPPLLKTANWLNHLDYDWQSPIWAPFLQRLAAGRRLIRYDARGNGLSDRDAEDISFDSFVRDLESVIDTTGLDRFPLLGISQGCAVSIAYAVKHPERLSHLILYGGFARGRRMRGNTDEIEQSDAVLTLMKHGWGQENPAFRQIFTSRFLPDGTTEQMRWFNDLQKNTTSPDNAVRLRLASESIDVTDLLAQVRVPTLVLHCRDDAAQPFEEGRLLAAGIPGARFVALEGRNHLMLENDPGFARFFDEVNAFLAT